MHRPIPSRTVHGMHVQAWIAALVLTLWCDMVCMPPVQELTKSMAMFGYDILQALVNDIAPDAKVRERKPRGCRRLVTDWRASELAAALHCSVVLTGSGRPPTCRLV